MYVVTKTSSAKGETNHLCILLPAHCISGRLFDSYQNLWQRKHLSSHSCAVFPISFINFVIELCSSTYSGSHGSQRVCSDVVRYLRSARHEVRASMHYSYVRLWYVLLPTYNSKYVCTVDGPARWMELGSRMQSWDRGHGSTSITQHATSKKHGDLEIYYYLPSMSNERMR